MSMHTLFYQAPISVVSSHSIAYLIVLLLLVSIQISEARERDPLVGPFPYDYSTRANVQNSLLLQEARQRKQPASNGAVSKEPRPGNSSLPNTPTLIGTDSRFAIINNTSTSISVGNWQQIEMTLGDGAEGLIMTESHQNSHGKTNSMSNIITTPNANSPKLNNRQD